MKSKKQDLRVGPEFDFLRDINEGYENIKLQVGYIKIVVKDKANIPDTRSELKDLVFTYSRNNERSKN